MHVYVPKYGGTGVVLNLVSHQNSKRPSCTRDYARNRFSAIDESISVPQLVDSYPIIRTARWASGCHHSLRGNGFGGMVATRRKVFSF